MFGSNINNVNSSNSYSILNEKYNFNGPNLVNSINSINSFNSNNLLHVGPINNSLGYIQSNKVLPKLKLRSLSPSMIPIKESIYSKVKISDVFAMEKLILPKFKF